MLLTCCRPLPAAAAFLFAILVVILDFSAAQDTRSACVWRPDTKSCAWNLLAPLSAIDSSAGLSLDAVTDQARSLVRAALLLEGCDARGAAGGRTTCEAPSANGACVWRSFAPSSSLWALLSQLLRADTNSANSSPDERCVPASLEVVLQPYLEMTAPEACYEIYDVPTCFASGPRCFYEDHESHSHCMPDWQFVRRSWGWPGPLATAAEQVSFLCNPESNWVDSHEARPARLDEAACRATATASATTSTPAGRFTVNSASAQWTRVLSAASAAALPGVADVFRITPPVPSPSPPSSPRLPPQQQPQQLPLPAPAATAQLPTPSGATCPPPPACPVCVSCAPPSSSAGSSSNSQVQQQQALAHNQPEASAVEDGAPRLLAVPTCQLLSGSHCTPTLLGVAAAVLAAMPSPPSEAALATARAVHGGLTAPGRTLLLAASEALSCAHSAAEPSGSSSAAPLPGTSLLLLPAAAADSCSRSTLAAAPAARETLADAFAPACSALGERTCASRPGCVLQAHDGHYDCVRSSRYAADYLLLSPSAPAPALPSASAGNSSAAAAALAAALQGLARQCRASLSTCGQQPLLNATLTPQSLSSFMAMATGRLAASPPSTTAVDGAGASLPAAVSLSAPPSVPAAFLKDTHSDEHEEEKDAQLVKSLRIAGVFVVLTAGIVGCCVPWALVDWLQLRPLLLASMRALSAGCILSLAMVHVSMHAISEMEGLVGGGGGGEDGHDHRRRRQLLTTTTRSLLAAGSGGGGLGLAGDVDEDYGFGGDDEHGGDGGRHHHPFPIGMCIVVFGFLVMAVVENVAHTLAERHIAKAAAAECARGRPPPADAAPAAIMAEPASCKQQADFATEASEVRLDVQMKEPEQALVCGPDSGDGVSGYRTCCNADSASGSGGGAMAPPAAEVASSAARARSVSTASMFEFGCMAHSVIIGLALGTATTVADCNALLVALSLHQFFEGFCLASVLLGVGVRRWRMAAMVLSYALMCPLGIAVGIAIVGTYDGESVTSRAVTGTINGVSGGLLLYLAAGMIMSDFGPHSTCGGGAGSCGTGRATRPWAAWERVVLFTLLFVSTGAFSVLALWA